MAVVNENVFFTDAIHLHERWKAQEFSATDLTRAFCDRLEKLGPRYNALALSLRKEALQAATDHERYAKSGRFKSPLHGVPFAVKDLLSVRGRPTTWGAKPYATQVFDEDAAVVTKLKKAGAIPIGKLSMVELAGGGGYRYASASLQGPGLNPWDVTRWSGGSSSGSAAAVAAGLVPFSLGSETSGSILTPAAFCGVTGLRPTYGLVSRSGAMALAWTMDKIGPLARTAEDCAMVLRLISGGGDARRSFYYAPQTVRPFNQLKAGYSRADFEGLADDGLRPALNAALEEFRKMGIATEEIELPNYPYSAIAGTVIGAEGSTVFAGLIESGQVEQLADARQIAGLKAGLEIPARDYLHAMRLRSLVQQRFRDLFGKIDLIIAPTRYSVAPPITEPLDRPSAPRPNGSARGMRDLIPAGNLAGLPAIALPCGFAERLPVSISLTARPFNENTMLAAAIEYQRRTSFHTQRPPME
jgi:aspartyl-tRNA(Asn)/glutamyl-tRNA(Gln) amidotransferase subunit A